MVVRWNPSVMEASAIGTIRYCSSAVETLATLLGFLVAAPCVAAIAVGKVAQDGGASWPAIPKGFGGALELLGQFVLGFPTSIDRFRDDCSAVVPRRPHPPLDGPAVDFLE